MGGAHGESKAGSRVFRRGRMWVVVAWFHHHQCDLKVDTLSA
jgi:hypothetical protein